jgi:RNA polymerase sigma-70 factor (ECF subfamily)
MTSAEKHKSTIDEAIARLISRAENSRSLSAADLRQRIVAALEKYLLRDDENASSADVRSFIDEIKADDLCLIIACERGNEKAWEDLVKSYDSTVKSAARKYAKNAEDAEDLAGSIWAELYGLKKDASGQLKTKLSYYSGRGSLAGWLRAVTNQLAVDQFRKESKFVQIEENREFENLANESTGNSDNVKIVQASDNPEENFSRKQTEKDVADALKQAIAELEAEDKLILKLYYFDDLKLKDIGTTLGFHEATASRKLDRLQKEIRKSVEKNLQATHGWKQEEVKRCLSDVASKLGISFERLFTILLILALVQENFWRGVL